MLSALLRAEDERPRDCSSREAVVRSVRTPAHSCLCTRRTLRRVMEDPWVQLRLVGSSDPLMCPVADFPETSYCLTRACEVR